MNSLESLLQQISLVLSKQNKAWALVGGLAVSVRTEPRFTRDLDLAVAVSGDTEAELLVHGLQGAGFQAFATVEHEKTNRLAMARMTPFGSSPQGLVLDLLFASSGIESEICAEAEDLFVFPELSVPVARIHHLMVLKALSRDDRTRPQDSADLQLLIANADVSDIHLACDAARLIEQRGFNRERDLVTSLRNAWKEFRS
jgi:predicted nucleotidyltransferase